ncbi:MAG: cystathionine beta-lyase [Alphaproteobacteria bacterium]
MREDSTIVAAGRHPHDHHGAINPPVYRVSTILSATLEEYDEKVRRRYEFGKVVFYGRFGTPTTFVLQDAVAALEGGHATAATASGLNAISTTLLAFLGPGDHLLMVDSAYSPTRMCCDMLLARMGIETTYYDPLLGADIAGLMRENTRVVFVESPGSLTFEVQDIPAIAAVAHERGAVVVMDNTWAALLYFKPFAHGVDVSIQAATKYIVGHSDAMLGTITCKDEETWEILLRTLLRLGVAAGSEECYLGQRGLRTLAVRLARHQESGLALARWLKARPEVERVLHPALPGDPGHELWRRDFQGACGLFGVVLAKPYPRAALAAMIDGFEHFGLGDSWGGYESLIVPKAPEQFRTASKWETPGPLLRIHAGLEDLDDLIEDLERGLARLAAAA